VVRDRVKKVTDLAERLSGELRTRYLRRSFAILAEHMNERTRQYEGFTPNYLNLTSTNIVDFEGIYFRNPLVSLHVDSQKCFVVTE